MKMYLFTLILVHFVSSCDVADKDENGLNPACNNAGFCYDGRCYCCPTYCAHIPYWTCDPNNPGWGCLSFGGDTCSEVDQKFYAVLGIRTDIIDEQSPADFTCSTDPKERYETNAYGALSAHYGVQVEYIAQNRGWPGSVYEASFCDSCSPAYPCKVGISEDVNATSGIGVVFQVDFNEYYDLSCGTGTLLTSSEDVEECEANYDYGLQANTDWALVQGDLSGGDVSFIEELNTLLQSESNQSNDLMGLGWPNTQVIGFGTQIKAQTQFDVIVLVPSFAPTSNPTPQPTVTPTLSPTQEPSSNPTVYPTDTPTQTPTDTPTQIPSAYPTVDPTQIPSAYPTVDPTAPTNQCVPYANDVNSMVFQGIGADCRAGLNISWPGGLSCDSPYIVCLPQENTPAKFGDQSYESSAYRYSVSECLQECANDQRCLGIEFVADSTSSLGDCNLIDDIPLEITSSHGEFSYDPAMSYTNLDSSVTNGTAMCFAKEDACYPYFEAAELNEAMLNCYCPNNRKGYYTKRVKRTMNNTRFCGNDSEVDLRVQKAQANRMFHLCENWCLFQTENPESESWYWDPWKTCWREQYAGVGEHMSYCSRVIRNPDTIEMQFVNHRSNQFCQTLHPTVAPSVMNSTWYMANEGESCDVACGDNGMVCNENLIASVVEPSSEFAVYFTEAGVTCSSIVTGEVDWALPGYEVSTATCLTRDNETQNTGCNWALGVGYQRLCACI